ncbi:ROK family protein, partial [Arthrobacter sp. Y81]
YGWPVLLANDANLAAMAERWMGAGAGVDDLAVMLAGERIGFGLMESGRLLHGASGRTGEVGLLHLVEGVGTPEGIALLAREMAVEACKKGAPQTLLTSLTTGTDTSTAAGPEDASIDGDAVGGDGGISAEAVFDAAARGDKVAGHILDTIARRMARVIALIATFNDPELVVIGGAVAAS